MLRLWLFLLLTLVASIRTVAQSQHLVDSIASLFQPEQPGKNLMSICKNSCELLETLPSHEALHIAKEINSKVNALKDPRLYIYANSILARVNMTFENYKEAYTLYNKIITLSKELNLEEPLAKLYYDLGRFQFRQQAYVDSKKNLHECKSIALRNKYYYLLFEYYGLMSTIHYQALNVDDLLRNIKEVQSISTLEQYEYETQHTIMSFYNTAGLIYTRKHMYDSALHYFDKSERIAIELKEKFWENLINGNKAHSLIQLKRYNEAIFCLENDGKTSAEHNEWESALHAYTMLVDVYREIDNVEKAEYYVKKADDAFSKLTNIDSRLYYQAKADLLFHKGNYKEAYLENQNAQREKVHIEEKKLSSNTILLQKRVSIDGIQKEIIALDESEVQQKKSLQFQEFVLYTALAAILLLILATLTFTRNYKRAKTINIIIQKHQQRTQETHQQLTDSFNNLKAAQAQLIQTEKMAFLGKLTSSIAHEINSPLGAIKGTSDVIHNYLKKIQTQCILALTNIPEPSIPLVKDLLNIPVPKNFTFDFWKQREEKNRCIKVLSAIGVEAPNITQDYVLTLGLNKNYKKWKSLLIEKDAQKILAIVSHLYTIESQLINIKISYERSLKMLKALGSYSYTSQNTISEIDLIQNIEVVLTIYAAHLNGIEIIREFDEISPIKGYPDELSQVWTNIIHNAIHAMNNQGKLWIRAFTESANNNVIIEIEDNGSGISPENMNKLYDSQFTTKAPGEGTGIGLSIVKKIIDRHQATITCFSTLGEGTKFKFEFPRTWLL
jgi:two-component system NtrC family sensor kinase